MKIKPIILSGGSGKRLWPLSTENKPKQFFDIFNKKINLFEETLKRTKNLIVFCSRLRIAVTWMGKI